MTPYSMRNWNLSSMPSSRYGIWTTQESFPYNLGAIESGHAPPIRSRNLRPRFFQYARVVIDHVQINCWKFHETGDLQCSMESVKENIRWIWGGLRVTNERYFEGPCTALLTNCGYSDEDPGAANKKSKPRPDKTKSPQPSDLRAREIRKWNNFFSHSRTFFFFLFDDVHWFQ